MESMPSVRFHPDREGLEAVMGPLEAKVMGVIWDRGKATVREVWDTLGGVREVAYTTVMTVCRRLHEKGYLERDTERRAHVYTPRSARPEFEQGMLCTVLRGILQQIRGGQAIGMLGDLSKSDRQLLRKMLDTAESKR